jgi:hypothetical protein
VRTSGGGSWAARASRRRQFELVDACQQLHGHGECGLADARSESLQLDDADAVGDPRRVRSGADPRAQCATLALDVDEFD